MCHMSFSLLAALSFLKLNGLRWPFARHGAGGLWLSGSMMRYAFFAMTPSVLALTSGVSASPDVLLLTAVAPIRGTDRLAAAFSSAWLGAIAVSPVAAAADPGGLPTGATTEQPKVVTNRGLLPARGRQAARSQRQSVHAGSLMDLVGKPRGSVTLLPWASSFHRQATL